MARVRPSMIAALLASVLVSAPASANPPQEFETEFWGTFHDPVAEKIVFANITRDALCGWIAQGQAGPPPVNHLVTFRDVETRPGVIVSSMRDTWRLEAFEFTGNPASGQDVCDGTADQSMPWATGEGHLAYTDNDVFVSGTRRNAFGFTITGWLTDDQEVFRFLRANRAHIIQNGDYIQVVDVISIR